MKGLRIFVLLCLSGPAIAADAARPNDEICYLLASVRESTCIFVRNGKRHTAAEAAAHLRMKLDRAGSRVTNAEAFIDRLASASSWTGNPYYIECNGEPMLSRAWLTERLETYRDTSRNAD